MLVDLGDSLQHTNALQILSKSKDLREACGLRVRNLVVDHSVELVMEEIKGVTLLQGADIRGYADIC